jgi:hypothetical protein
MVDVVVGSNAKCSTRVVCGHVTTPINPSIQYEMARVLGRGVIHAFFSFSGDS